jgi:hypothetical protein
MQTLLRRTSLVLFGLVALFLVWFGVTYATVNDMLWFHAAAVPEGVRIAVRPLYFALMNLIGASSAALGVLSLYIIAMPLRRGAPGAGAALVIVNTIVFVMAAITAEELAAATGSPTSWHIMGALMAVTAAAFACHTIAATRRGRTAQQVY